MSKGANDIFRDVPQDLPTEGDVLGTVLQNPHFLEGSGLNLDCFWAEDHRKVWRTIERLWRSHTWEAVNSNAVVRELGETAFELRWHLPDGEFTGRAGWQHLFTKPRSHIHFQLATKALKNYALARKAQRAGAELSATSPTQAAEVAARIRDQLDGLLANAEPKQPRTIGEVAQIVANRYQARLQGAGSGLTTGFPALDKRTGGIQRDDYIAIAARPGMGKSAFVMQVVHHVATTAPREACGVLYASLEMSDEDMTERFLTQVARLSAAGLRDGSLPAHEVTRMMAEVAAAAELPIVFHDDPGTTPVTLHAYAKHFEARHGTKLALIVVDYLQLMHSGRRYDSRRDEVGHVSMELRRLARDLGVPVIVCAQLNRSCDSREDKRPVKSDLGESGQIERDITQMWALYRDEEYYDDTPDLGIAEVLIRKARKGCTGTVKLKWIAEEVRFDNLDWRDR